VHCAGGGAVGGGVFEPVGRNESDRQYNCDCHNCTTCCDNITYHADPNRVSAPCQRIALDQDQSNTRNSSWGSNFYNWYNYIAERNTTRTQRISVISSPPKMYDNQFVFPTNKNR
jgi:hypothetical protein